MKVKVKLKERDCDVDKVASMIAGKFSSYDEDDMILEMEMEEEDYDEDAILEMEEVEDVEMEEEMDESFKMPSASQYIKESVENEGDLYGDQISAINDWLQSEHPDHDEFVWDGDKLKVTFKEGEPKEFTEAELKDLIDNFPVPETMNEAMAKFLAK